MNKEVFSSKQGIFLIIIFILDGAIMLPIALDAKKDLWLSILLSIIISIPFIYIYSKILSCFPGKDLFDILEFCFGKYIGKLFSLLYIWFAFHLASIILRDFGEYFLTVALPETPLLVTLIPPVVLSIWMLKSGLEVFGRVSSLVGVLLILAIFLISTLLLKNIDLNNIKPVLGYGIKPVLKGAYNTFAFPFGETVIFTMVLSNLNNEKSYFKVYLIGVLIGGLALFYAKFFDITVLGINIFSSKFFPGYETFTRIDVGNIFKRLDIIGGLIFTVATFIKLTVCILAVNKGVQKVFDLKDYKFIVTPVCLILLNLSLILYDGLIELVEWSSKIWPYYSIPFQIIIPIVVVIILQIKKKILNINI